MGDATEAATPVEVSAIFKRITNNLENGTLKYHKALDPVRQMHFFQKAIKMQKVAIKLIQWKQTGSGDMPKEFRNQSSGESVQGLCSERKLRLALP